ncbi:Very short patch repair protein [subsurface metagenome]
MVDVHTKEQRSYNMSRIKSAETKAELKIKPFLKILGFIYQPKNVYGKPDFIHRKEKIAIFVDGCFWHKCPKHYKKPTSNKKFWEKKINKNAERDKKVTKKLRKDGWGVIRIWEHDMNKIK